MAITKLTVENFKSFDKLEVKLRPFSIVVGSNASGKSNFLDVFRFLRDIESTSLESAIGIRGGAEALRNFNLDENQDLRICVETDDVQRYRIPVPSDSVFGTKTDRTTYELSLRFDESDVGFEVVTDRLIEHFTIFELGSPSGPDGTERHVWSPHVSSRSDFGASIYSEVRSLGNGTALYNSEDGWIEFSVELPEGIPFKPESTEGVALQ